MRCSNRETGSRPTKTEAGQMNTVTGTGLTPPFWTHFGLILALHHGHPEA